MKSNPFRDTFFCVPCHSSAVKDKLGISSVVRSIGAVDLHFHGAFGIDLMSADEASLNDLSAALWKSGLAGFCPTTLSVPLPLLKETCARLGRWIASQQAPGARPLGIHLEGPFLNPKKAGAHPPRALRPLNLEELQELWRLSQGTVRILTLAPELLTKQELHRVCKWAKRHSIRLSIGHSEATELQAQAAVQSGFSGITHAWNALSFHQRDAGALAVFARPEVYPEVIADGVHVSHRLVSWASQLAPERLVLVSDCVPAAACPAGRWYSFGNLKIRVDRGACRLKNGALAGGAALLPEAYGAWLRHTLKDHPGSSRDRLRRTLPFITSHPLRALGLSPQVLGDRQRAWKIDAAGRLTSAPLPSSLRKRG